MPSTSTMCNSGLDVLNKTFVFSENVQGSSRKEDSFVNKNIFLGRSDDITTLHLNISQNCIQNTEVNEKIREVVEELKKNDDVTFDDGEHEH